MIVYVNNFAERGVLGSEAYLRLLDFVELELERPQSLAIIDLTPITWISHLPLVALAMAVDRIRAEGITNVEIHLPASPTASGFLIRWGFITYVQGRGCRVIQAGEPKDYQRAPNSRVLPLGAFDNLTTAWKVSETLRTKDDKKQTLITNDEALRALLERAGFRPYDIAALADLIVDELCVNAAEHGRTGSDSFSVGHVADRRTEKATRRRETAAPWEADFAASVAGEGATEIVVADSGIGIVASLQKAALSAKPPHKDYEEIAKWAFDPYSTRKQDPDEHTRGLSTVKGKVRQLRGALFVRTSYPEPRNGRRGVQLWWDFLRDPGRDEPHAVEDEFRVKGTQIQILLPRRGLLAHKTYIVSQLNVTPAVQARQKAVEIRRRQQIARISAEARAAEARDVLFVHVVPDPDWSKDATDTLAKALAHALTIDHARVWLLNPDEALVERLRTSAPVQTLWFNHAVAIPIVRLVNPPAPPKWEFLYAEKVLPERRVSGDTDEARSELVDLMTKVLTDGSGHTEALEHLTDEERHWVGDALAKNPSVVRHIPHLTLLQLEPPFDLGALGREAGQALLTPTLREAVKKELAEQDAAAPVWYRLPSGLYCRNYISPRLLDKLRPYDRHRIEQWIERAIREISPGWAISFGPFAGELLTRAVGALPSVHDIHLDHYVDVNGIRRLEQLERIPEGEKAVFLVGITGSGRTLFKVKKKLVERKVDLEILSVIDTMSERDRRDAPILDRMRRNDQLRSIVEQPIEKLRTEEHKAIPLTSPEATWPTVHIDPETLLPIATATSRDKLWTDGEFWSFVYDAEALSSSRIIYRGLELPSFIWIRNLLHDRPAADRLLRDLRKLDPKPEILLAMEDFSQAVRGSWLERELTSDSSRKQPWTYRTDWNFDLTDMESRRVVILCGAASSGTELARALQKVALAKTVDVLVVLNRMPLEIASAFVKPPRVRLRSCQWLSLASPGSRQRHGRSEALRQLNEYRRSALTNRLIVFIDEKKDDLLRASAYVDNHVELEFYDPVRTPKDGPRLFEERHTYDLATPAGQADIRRIVNLATDSQSEWIRVVLLECTARYDSTFGEAGTEEFQRIVLELLESLEFASPRLIKAVVDAMLLERSIGPRSNPKDEVSSGARQLAEHLWRRYVALEGMNQADVGSACIRAIAKLDVRHLLDNLSQVLKIAAEHRETELSLSLELTKIAVGPFEAQLRSALQVIPAGPLPGGQKTEVQMAVAHLLADLGYESTAEGLAAVRWVDRFDALETELPDAERGIRALVRSAHDLVPDAHVTFFRAADGGGFTLTDSWPPRERGSRARPASVYALELVNNERTVYYESVVDSAVNVRHLRQTAENVQAKGDMSLLLIRVDPVESEMRRSPLGVLSVQRGYPKGPREIDRQIRSELLTLADRAAAVIDRAHIPASMKMGEWAYQQSMSKGDASGALQEFIDNLRRLLGADLGRVVVLGDDHTWRSTLTTGDWGADDKPVAFPDNDQTYMTVMAVHAGAGPQPRLALDVQEELAHEKAHPPNLWVHGAVCIPLAIPGKPCRAAVTLWHHTRGWFHAVGHNLLVLIGRLGGALYELTLVPDQINQARHEIARALAARHAERILLEAFQAKAYTRQLKRVPQPHREVVDHLNHALIRLEEIAEEYQGSATLPISKRVQPLGGVVEAVAGALSAQQTPVIYRPDGELTADFDADILREVLTAFVKGSRTVDDRAPVHMRIEGPNERECRVIVESTALALLTDNPSSLSHGKVLVRGREISLVSAFFSMEQHGGRIEVEPDRKGFRIVLSRAGGDRL